MESKTRYSNVNHYMYTIYWTGGSCNLGVFGSNPEGGFCKYLYHIKLAKGPVIDNAFFWALFHRLSIKLWPSIILSRSLKTGSRRRYGSAPRGGCFGTSSSHIFNRIYVPGLQSAGQTASGSAGNMQNTRGPSSKIISLPIL